MLTIYTTGPKCNKCNLTKDRFDKAGVEYKEELLTELPELADAFRDAGHGMAPVVVDQLTGVTWSDFRHDQIKAAIKARA